MSAAIRKELEELNEMIDGLEKLAGSHPDRQKQVAELREIVNLIKKAAGPTAGMPPHAAAAQARAEQTILEWAKDPNSTLYDICAWLSGCFVALGTAGDPHTTKMVLMTLKEAQEFIKRNADG